MPLSKGTKQKFISGALFCSINSISYWFLLFREGIVNYYFDNFDKYFLSSFKLYLLFIKGHSAYYFYCLQYESFPTIVEITTQENYNKKTAKIKKMKENVIQN